MKLKDINITDTLAKAREHASEKNLPLGTKELFILMILIIELLVSKFGANSKNSSKPPSLDPNRKKNGRTKTNKKVGGQKGHIGTTLVQVEDPDVIIDLAVDKSTLPPDQIFKKAEPIVRQVFDVIIDVKVTEYRAEVLIDRDEKKYSAQFPENVNSPVQYGNSVKGLAVYLSNYQMIPFERMRDLFCHQIGLPISTGTLANFNNEAAQKLASFEDAAKSALIESSVLHHDETGVNINGTTFWLHSASNALWTYFSAHKKRGKEAMDAVGILPKYAGILIHDHWKPYFGYTCEHAVCNAHILRELERAAVEDNQQWAKDMQALLRELNIECDKNGGSLTPEQIEVAKSSYEAIINRGFEECPLESSPPGDPKKRGRQKKSKSRNLLERLHNYQKETLRFIEDKRVPFTNNLSERDIRMTKVHQKISGCFKSIDTAQNFCRIRSFISTCMKQGFEVASSLTGIFQNSIPNFVSTASSPT